MKNLHWASCAAFSEAIMNKTSQLLTVAVLMLAGVAVSSPAQAKSEFPVEIRNKFGLTYDVPCAVCHLNSNIGSSTPITLFALSLRARGLTGSNQSLDSALTKLESDAVDSDGDGVTDVQELTDGTDPNSSANGSIMGNQEPGYGCGGTAPHGRSGAGIVGILALGWLVVRRRRGDA